MNDGTLFSLPHLLNMLTEKNALHIMQPPYEKNHVYVSDASLNKSTYTDIRGPLAAMSKRLKDIAAQGKLESRNYSAVLDAWASAFITGLVTYNPTPFKFVLEPEDELFLKYSTLVKKFSTEFVKVFTSEKASVNANYENYEFFGDSVYKNAIVTYFTRELNIRNKTIATVMKHHHENTKALSDLAEILGLTDLINNGGEEISAAVREDVFESLIGFMTYFEWELCRDTTSDNSMIFANGNSIVNRFVRMVFSNSDYTIPTNIAAKTFLTSIKRMFSEKGDEIRIDEASTQERAIITIKTSANIISNMARVFSVDRNELTKILHCTYTSKNVDVNIKTFANVVYSGVVEQLKSIGIGQQEVQAYKNLKMIPRAKHQRMMALYNRALELGYWFGFNVPKKMRHMATTRISLEAVLYHDRKDYGLVHVTSEGPANEILSVIETLLCKIEDVIKESSAKPAGKPHTLHMDTKLVDELSGYRNDNTSGSGTTSSGIDPSLIVNTKTLKLNSEFADVGSDKLTHIEDISAGHTNNASHGGIVGMNMTTAAGSMNVRHKDAEILDKTQLSSVHQLMSMWGFDKPYGSVIGFASMKKNITGVFGMIEDKKLMSFGSFNPVIVGDGNDPHVEFIFVKIDSTQPDKLIYTIKIYGDLPTVKDAIENYKQLPVLVQKTRTFDIHYLASPIPIHSVIAAIQSRAAF